MRRVASPHRSIISRQSLLFSLAAYTTTNDAFTALIAYIQYAISGDFVKDMSYMCHATQSVLPRPLSPRIFSYSTFAARDKYWDCSNSKETAGKVDVPCVRAHVLGGRRQAAPSQEIPFPPHAQQGLGPRNHMVKGEKLRAADSPEYSARERLEEDGTDNDKNLRMTLNPCQDVTSPQRDEPASEVEPSSRGKVQSEARDEGLQVASNAPDGAAQAPCNGTRQQHSGEEAFRYEEYPETHGPWVKNDCKGGSVIELQRSKAFPKDKRTPELKGYGKARLRSSGSFAQQTAVSGSSDEHLTQVIGAS